MTTAVVVPDLRSQLDEVDATYAEALERHRAVVSNLAGDMSGDDVADSGMKVAVTGEDEAEIRRLADRRFDIEDALAKFDAGTYGQCESCGKPIPAERLLLMPGATTCVSCKSKAERYSHR